MILEKNQQIDQWRRIDSAERDTHKKSNGSLTKDQLKEIAEIKLPDLNCYTVEEAMKIVEGTARNMGVTIK